MPEGLCCVVTGASSGIGRETARLLSAGGHTVIGVGRDAARCRAAQEAIRTATKNPNVHILTADLSSQEAIKRLSRAIEERLDKVDVLVNNAGTFTFRRAESRDGVEMQLAVNYLAGFLLTGLLIPLLAAAPAARVITTSSGSHFAGRIRWKDVMIHRGYNGLAAYDQSKLATVLFTRELARRLGPGSRISVFAVDPGLVKTEIALKGNNRLVRLAWRVRTRKAISAEKAAESLLFCAVDPAVQGRTGLYWKECVPLTPSPAACSSEDGRRLWQLSEKVCGFSYDWPAPGPATAC
jgi:NAD(P)-dependent dehydrogenase (short-subunit alcohol dehydrogenase family)